MNKGVLVFLLVGGCIKGATEEQTEPPPAPRTEAVYAARTEQPRDNSVVASLSEEEAAYWADCSHRSQVQQDESEEIVDACMFMPYDQNCAPDPSGCWERGQACISACGPACGKCDDVCGRSCEDCKAECANDSACLVACVRARVECHGACIESKETCMETTCREEETRCYEAHDAAVAQTCPKCEQIRDCVGDAYERDRDPMEMCGKKFKREPSECFEWCLGW